jgi:hypothetical protein
MATGNDKFPGSKVPYHFTAFDTALAAAGTIAVTHAADPNKVRKVTVIDQATGNIVPFSTPAGNTAQCTFTSNTVTTITNRTGGTVNWLVVVTVNP